MDSARCTCPRDSLGARCDRNLDCAIHGFTSGDPLLPWDLSLNDRRFLRALRIGNDSAEIQEVRQADEDRFKP